jgi:hypothetical protein
MADYYKEDTAGKAAFYAKMDMELLARMETACAYAEGRVKDALNQPGSGIVYNISGKIHQASAPGETPVPLTGNLKGSIDHFVGMIGRDVWGVISTAVEYAPALEFGTRRMAPRPFMRKTIIAHLPVIWKIIRGVGI